MRLFLISLAALLLSACATTTHSPVHTAEQAAIVAPAAQQTDTAPQTPLANTVAIPFTANEESMAAALQPQPPPAALDSREVECVAMAMYHEARGEGDVGMAAVGYTIKNRMASSTFPDTACGVVYQGDRDKHGRLIKGRCQFNWACTKTKKDQVPRDQASYAKCTDMAKLVLLGVAPNPIGKLKFFHGTSDKSPPSKKLASRKRVGHHLFYDYATSVASR